jgi:endonuclease/exonuclease/phosphatase family metal-dependent hydrolase
VTVLRRRGIRTRGRSWFTLVLVVVSIFWLIVASQHNGEPSKKRPRVRSSGFAGDSPWVSAAACEKALGLKKSRAKRGGAKDKYARIGSWNLNWFPDGTSDKRARAGGTNVEWLACLIAWMDLQAVAVQEVQQNLRGRRATQDLLDRLDEYTDGRWQAKFDDCPDDGRQHVGLLFDTKRVMANALRTVPSLNPTGSRCRGRLRPGYAAYLRFSGGADLHLVILHLDSGVLSRDYRNRVTSWRSLKALIRDRNRVVRDDDIVVMGDFNTMGCTKCAEHITAEEEIDRLEQLLCKPPAAMRRLRPSHRCTSHYRGRGNTLDHIFVDSTMEEIHSGGTAQVNGLCAELSCFRKKGFPKTALSHLSDHCPIVVELLNQDLD